MLRRGVRAVKSVTTVKTVGAVKSVRTVSTVGMHVCPVLTLLLLLSWFWCALSCAGACSTVVFEAL